MDGNVTASTLNLEFVQLLRAAKAITADLDDEVMAVLTEGTLHPLEDADALTLLNQVIDALVTSASKRNDSASVASLNSGRDELLRLALDARSRFQRAEATSRPRLQTITLLNEHNGYRRGPVKPTPVFHEKEIPMEGGFIRTSDIRLWGSNERLEIHVGQFKAKFGRPPTPDELFQIMVGQMQLDGVSKQDEFDIQHLARSIAANGVRKPPIIDVDGTLLDGNRRIAASTLILNDTSGEFTSQDKKRAEYVYVWQLTPYATDDDRDRVIVSLNFESDFKKEWPEYIKARKVAADWEALLALEPTKPSAQRQATLKRDLSRKYALGPDTNVVNRYLKMVQWAVDFEDHHINGRQHDEFAVRHAATRYFQYFDEMSKGLSQGGVAWTLTQDDGFRQIVFDLLFEGKFENWNQIRALKYIHGSAEAKDILAKAHEEKDVETAQEHLGNAITIANTKRAEQRSLGANSRIETFSKWIEEIPPRTLRDEVKPDNLQRLLRALQLVEPIVAQSLKVHRDGASA
jgi:hypothetical protein